MAAGACVARGHAWLGGVWLGACVTKRHVWPGACVAGGHAREEGMHGGHVWQGVCMAGGMHGRRDGHCSRLYASYWNAFLLKKYIWSRSKYLILWDFDNIFFH